MTKRMMYFSRAVSQFDDRELSNLLLASRSSNAARSITGFLVFDGCSFIQFIEGPDEAVEDLIAKIKADPRHEGFGLFFSEPCAKSIFPDWSMACIRVDESLAGFHGDMTPEKATRFLEIIENNSFPETMQLAEKILELFRQQHEGLPVSNAPETASGSPAAAR